MKIMREHSMLLKRWWEKVDIFKKPMWSRLSMDKLFILKSSLWMNHMITIFTYHRDRIIANEIRRSQHLDTPIISQSTIHIVQKTKDVLRINIQQNALTRGLPKYREV